MNILFIIVTLEGGGAQKLINDFAPEINKKYRCQVLVLSAKDDRFSEALRKNGVTCLFIPDTVKGKLGRLRYIDRVIGQGRFDIVHVNLFPPLYYCSILKRFKYKNLSFIYTEHNTDNRRRHVKWLRPVEKWIYAPYDYIVSISNDTRLELVKWIGASKKEKRKFPVIPNGIPLDEYMNAVSYKKTDINPGICEEDVLLCMTGSFTEQKNHRFMIEVMKKLPENYKLMLLGEGILKDEIKDAVNASCLKDRVFFMGYRKDAAAFVKASDLVVIPSKWEGFGLVAAEAMACGKQVVCFDVPGLSDVVGDAGIKVTYGDLEGFAESIMNEVNESGKDEKIRKARKQAELFDLERMKENYFKLYSKCIMQESESAVCCKQRMKH